MGKKVGGVNWRAVALEGVPMDGTALEGFIGLEECTDYDLGTKSEGKRKRKQKKPKQTQRGPTPSLGISKSQTAPTPKNNTQTRKTEEPAAKRTKLTNGFVVETCVKTKPSTDNDIRESDKTTSSERIFNETETLNKAKTNLSKESRTLSDETARHALELDEKTTEYKLGMDDMQAWSQFQVPEEILKALAEQGFEKPTRIQELCLPPAMLGRRDILGAAETGSGKTLAFGIPILAGIMKLKENEKAGLDVYDMRYKKTSVKRNKSMKEKDRELKDKDVKKLKRKHVKKNTAKKITNGDNEIENSDDEAVGNENINDEKREEHESYEGTDSEGENSDDETQIQNNNAETQNDDIGSESHDNETHNEDNKSDSNNETQNDDNETEKNDNEDDSDDNYIHLSDMFDSDDLEDSSDEENDKIIDPAGSDDEIDHNDELDDESVSDEEEVNADKVGEGIGCVKVVDDVELPPRRVVKTGRPLYALVVTPTRELAMQISRHMIAAAKYTGIRVAVLVGGMARVKQERVLAGGPEVVVCTPGRLWELLQQGDPHLQQLDHIKFLAIDETDRMLERNHFEELQPLLERLNADERRRADRQSFVMSATLTMTHDLPSHLRGKKVTKRGKIINRKVQRMTPQQKTKRLISVLGMTDPKIVDLTAENHGTAGTLTECRITCALEHKDYYLFYVLRTHPGRTIVFCNSIGCVKRLAQLFALLKCRPLPLHAGMPQRQRLKNLERFRDDPRGVLIATDVAARGLDIPNVDHVIHYQVPRTAENYVHRSGRTARANKEGLTILMMEPGEAYLYSKLCRTLNKTAELAEFPVPERVLASMRACVALARDVEAAALACKRRAQEAGWLERVARECDLVVDNDFLPMKKQLDSHDAAATTKALQHKKKQLEAMLTRPMFPKGFSYKYPGLNEANALVIQSEENALQAMKRVLETGAAKKERRRSKNAPLLSLEKTFQPKSKEPSRKGGKVEKRRKKKFYKKSS